MNVTPEPDAAYVLAVLRGEVPADLVPVYAHQWPEVIDALRELGYEIRETANGYQLVGDGHDDDGTGYSAPTTYQPTDPDTIHRMQGETAVRNALILHTPTVGEAMHVALTRVRNALERSEPVHAVSDPHEPCASDHMDTL